MKKTKSKRRRISKEDVRNNARENQSGSGRKYFNLPNGVDLWRPESAKTYMIDIVPYEIKTEKHPDRRGDKVVPGDLYWKYPFSEHRNIGPSNDAVLCPASFGEPCPICEAITKLKKNYDDNKDVIDGIKDKKQVAYIIKNPDEEGKYCIFTYSQFQFGDALDTELKEGGDEVLSFFDTTEEGKTLKVRFVEESFKKGKFLKADRIDFKDREEMDEDEVLDAVPCLDEIFVVPDYDEIKALFLQTDAAPADSTDKDEDDEDDDKPRQRKDKSKPAEEEDEEDDSEDEDEEDSEEESAFSKGQKVAFTIKGKKLTGKVVEVDEDDVTIAGSDGKEYDIEASKVTTVGKAKAEPEEEDNEEDDDTKEGEEKQSKSSKSAKKGKTKPAEEEEDEEDSEDEDEDDEDDEKEDPKSKSKFKVGDHIKDDDGKTGVIVAIKGDDVTIKDEDGDKVLLDIDDIEIDEDAKPSKSTKKGKAEPEDDDEEDSEDEDDDEDDTDEDDDKPTFSTGDPVMWDDGGEEGTFVKMHSSGEKARVKGDDGEVWIAIEDLKAKAAPKGKTKKK